MPGFYLFESLFDAAVKVKLKTKRRETTTLSAIADAVPIIQHPVVARGVALLQ